MSDRINDPPKIDFIFPWVNPLDKNWRDIYRKRTGLLLDPDSDNGARFRDSSNLKYLFRCIATNMPWLNKVHIILMCESQVPEWLNTEEVDVIYHSEFIPIQYRPVFNSNAIEAWLPNIALISKGLPVDKVIPNPNRKLEIADNFIYSNDDVYPLTPSKPSDFYDPETNKPIIATTIKNSTLRGEFLRCVKRSFDLISVKIRRRLAGDQFYKPCHIFTPLNTNALINVYNLCNNELRNSCTRLRDNSRNINQYIYSDYLLLSGQCLKRGINTIGRYLSYDRDPIILKQSIMNPNPAYKSTCINDLQLDRDKFDRAAIIVTEALEEKYPNKCKYEK